MAESLFILPSSEVSAWKRRQEFFWEQLASGRPPLLYDAYPENHPDEKDWNDNMSNVSVTDIVTALKKDVDSKGLIDISSGVEEQFGVSKPKFRSALSLLEKEGYNTYYRSFTQVGTTKKASLKVLVAPGMTYREMYNRTVNAVSKPADLE